MLEWNGRRRPSSLFCSCPKLKNPNQNLGELPQVFSSSISGVKSTSGVSLRLRSFCPKFYFGDSFLVRKFGQNSPPSVFTAIHAASGLGLESRRRCGETAPTQSNSRNRSSHSLRILIRKTKSLNRSAMRRGRRRHRSSFRSAPQPSRLRNRQLPLLPVMREFLPCSDLRLQGKSRGMLLL